MKTFRPEKFAQERLKFLRVIPHEVEIAFEQKDGVFYATIKGHEDISTFGYSESEAIEMAHDALLTYFGIPREIASDISWEKTEGGGIVMVDNYEHQYNAA